MATQTQTETIQEGIPLIELPETILVARILAGENARTIYEAYQEALSEYNDRARQTLDVFKLEEDLMTGSSIFAILKLSELLDEARTATSADLAQIVNTNPDYLRRTYEDTTNVVLRSAGDFYEPNDYLAKDLAKQIRKREFKVPIMISGLTTQEDEQSSYGLRFELTDKTEVIDAPQLSHENNGRRFSRTDEMGMPIFDENGQITLHTREDGLSRLGIHWVLGLHSYWYILADSAPNGRVVVVSSEAAS